MLRSLSGKTNVAIAVVLILILGLSGYLTLSTQNRQAEENAKNKAKLLTQTVTNIIRLDMKSPHPKDLEKIIAVVGQFQEIETLRVFNSDGQILHSVLPEEVGLNIDELVMNVFLSGDMTKPFRSGDEGHRSMCRVEVIYNEAECFRCHGPEKEIIGVLEVCLSMADMDLQIQRNARFILLSTIATIFAVTLVVSVLTGFVMKRPIAALVKVMRQAQAGDFAVRASDRKSDELGRLGQSFNEMISKLDETQREVERLHNEQMSRAERLASIGEMAASVAHEIKNPLAGLSGAAQVLAKSFAEEDGRRAVADEMLKLTGRLDKTINDLLSFARVSEPNCRDMNVNDVVEEALFFLRRDRKLESCTIRAELDPAMPEIPLDPQQLQQVLYNLIINARQAVSDGGTVVVATASRPSGPMPSDEDPDLYVEIRVEDNGTGIPEEKRGEIFKPFFTTKVQGTGLGLPISRNIVEAHDGVMGFHTNEGVGTSFYVWLRKKRVSA